MRDEESARKTSVAFEKYSIFSRLISDEIAIMAILGIIIGLAGGFGAIGFRYLIGFFQAISYGSAGELLDVISSIPWYFRIGIPALGGLVIGPIVYFLAREAKGHGVPEVMEAVAMQRGIIRKRIVFIKALVSAICMGTGGSAGREGPIVQIGSAAGSTLGQMLKVSANRMRVLVGCGAAAGIAATFNALEQITLRDFSILPVVSPNNSLQLLGVLTRKDILDAYDRAMIKKSLMVE